MEEVIRRAVAYAAVGRVKGRFGSSIYSHENGSYTQMSSSYDYGASAHIDGMKSGDMYHYGLGAHIDLEVKDNSFSGYDYASGSHFEGNVSREDVELYDYGTGCYYNYKA